MARTRAVVLGGKGFNVPKQLRLYFEVVLHIEQDMSRKFQSIPQCDIILVIRDYVHHAAVEQVAQLAPGVPIVAARAGWSHLYTELQRRKLLPVLEDPILPQEASESEELVPAAEPLPVEDQISEEELEKLTAPSAPPPADPAGIPLRLLAPQENQEPAQDDRVETLADLFKESGGEITHTIRELYREKYKEGIPGPIAAAARRRLGMGPKREGPILERVAENPALKEALILYGNVDKLLARRNELLSEIEKRQEEVAGIDSELSVYKPIIQQFEALKAAQVKVKADLEKRSLQERRQTS